MKITKRQLRRIIKEEKARILKEQPTMTGWDNFTPEGEAEDEAYLAASNSADRAVGSDAIDMLNDILDDWDNDPTMSGRMEYYNRIIGVTKLLERS